MVKTIQAFQDNDGNIHKTARDAVIAEIAATLGGEGGEGGLAYGSAARIFDNWDKLAHIVNTYQVMPLRVKQE